MTKNEALKLALAFIAAEGWGDSDVVITAINEALAQPSDSVEQEPVRDISHGWIVNWPSPGGRTKPLYHPTSVKPKFGKAFDEKLVVYPVYTTPPKREWVGLTDENIEAARIRVFIDCGADLIPKVAVHLARVIEARIKELNT